jgi:hypothetical protein
MTHGALRCSMLARVLFSSRQGGVIRGTQGACSAGGPGSSLCAESDEAVPWAPCSLPGDGPHVSARARATACARR